VQVKFDEPRSHAARKRPDITPTDQQIGKHHAHWVYETAGAECGAKDNRLPM
jgi:hypothetical protein